jgi:hypothetical protein
MLFHDFQRLEEPIRASFTRPLAPEPEPPNLSRAGRNRRAG